MFCFQFKCCGVNNASDWETVGSFPTKGLGISKDALKELATQFGIQIPDLGGLPNIVDGARVPEGCCHFKGEENIFTINDGDNDAVKASSKPTNLKYC